MKKYIHYGHKHFNKEKFNIVENRLGINKPKGGLWASPVDAKLGWKQWCDDNYFRECDKNNSFAFVLKENANVIHLYSVEDVERLLIKAEKPPFDMFIERFLPDFETMKSKGVDAIELHLSEDKSGDYFDNLYYKLYGWDCDSILILNPDVVIEIK